MKKRDFKVAAISVVVTLVVILVIAWVLHLFSFEIVYDPKVITNWDAVSGVAAWAGVIVSSLLSLAAIWFAIQVPKKIADRQDKIELFGKRYDVLQSFAKCRIFYLTIMRNQDLQGLQNACCQLLEIKKISDMTEKNFARKAEEFQYIFSQIPFIFSGVDDKAMAMVYDSLWELLGSVIRGEPAKKVIEKRTIYLNATYEFNEKYWPKMMEETSIKNL